MLPPFFKPEAAHARVTNLSSAVTLTTPSGGGYLLMQAFTANVRFTLDGTTPTASMGFQLKAGDPPLLINVRSGAMVINVKVIQEAANAEIQYQFLG